MSEANHATETKEAAARPKKTYSPPTLTECGSVAKLTMAKGTTDVEISPNKKRANCL